MIQIELIENNIVFPFTRQRKREQVEQFESDSENGNNNEPIYFNIIEEKSISWSIYLNTCK